MTKCRANLQNIGVIYAYHQIMCGWVGEVAATDKQAMLEAQWNKPIKAILTETMESNRGRKNFVVVVSAALGISVPTLYFWSKDLGIVLDEYRLSPV